MGSFCAREDQKQRGYINRHEGAEYDRADSGRLCRVGLWCPVAVAGRS